MNLADFESAVSLLSQFPMDASEAAKRYSTEVKCLDMRAVQLASNFLRDFLNAAV